MLLYRWAAIYTRECAEGLFLARQNTQYIMSGAGLSVAIFQMDAQQ